jgi:hypothetical protein
MPRRKKCRHRADGEKYLLTFLFIGRFGCGIVLFNLHNETHPLVGEPRIGRASNASGPDFDSYFLIPYAFRKHQSRAGLLRQA